MKDGKREAEQAGKWWMTPSKIWIKITCYKNNENGSWLNGSRWVLQWNIWTYVGRHGKGIVYHWVDMNLNGIYEL